MYKQFFAGMDFTALPLFAMALFGIFFALVVLRTFALRRKTDFDEVASLPLEHQEAGHE